MITETDFLHFGLILSFLNFYFWSLLYVKRLMCFNIYFYPVLALFVLFDEKAAKDLTIHRTTGSCIDKAV